MTHKPPALTLRRPMQEMFLERSTLLPSASDNVGVKGVQFLLDGTNLNAEDTVAPSFYFMEYAIDSQRSSCINGKSTRCRRQCNDILTRECHSCQCHHLIAAINLNEGTGTAAADVSGNNHNGTLVNSPTWVAGKYGQAVNFNGTSNYINYSATRRLQP